MVMGLMIDLVMLTILLLVIGYDRSTPALRMLAAAMFGVGLLAIVSKIYMASQGHLW